MSDTPDAPAADAGPLSIDSAVEMLTAPEAGAEEQPAEVEVEDEEQSAEAQTVDGEDPPEEEPVEAEEELEGDPETAIAAPKSWDAAARAEFALLPAALQKTVAAREEERDRAVSRAQTEASEAKKLATAEASTLGQYKAHLDQLIPQAQSVFADKWANVDWVAWAAEDPAAAQIGRFQYESERGELARLQAVHQQTEQVAFAQFLATENERLKDVAPALADPKDGPAKREAVGKYLVAQGIQPEQLRHVTASELAIAHKAMLWDEAQAAHAKPKPPKPATPAARPALRPAAAQPVSSPAKRTAIEARNRFAQTRSLDDAVAAIIARG